MGSLLANRQGCQAVRAKKNIRSEQTERISKAGRISGHSEQGMGHNAISSRESTSTFGEKKEESGFII